MQPQPTAIRALIREANHILPDNSKFNRPAPQPVKRDGHVTEQVDSPPRQWVRATGERPDWQSEG